MRPWWTRPTFGDALASRAWLAFGSPHRWLAPAWLAALHGISRSPHTLCFAKRSMWGTVPARNSEVPLTERLATRSQQILPPRGTQTHTP